MRTLAALLWIATSAGAWVAGAQADDIQSAIEAGDFRHAEERLRAKLSGPDGKPDREAEVALEILRRIRLDFSLSANELLAKLRKSIPDVTPDDIDKWRQAGGLQFRTIDGEIRYFNREPSNLYRFRDEARQRRGRAREAAGPTTRPAQTFVLTDHLAKVIEQAESSNTAEVGPLRHRVRYKLKVNDGHPLVKTGAVVRCWLPYPQEYRRQTDVKLIAAGPGQPVIAPNGHPQRTLYLEHVIEDASKPVEFAAEFEFTSRAYYPRLNADKAQPYEQDGDAYRQNTIERPPHIVFTPLVQRLVAEIVGDETNPLVKARRIYLWVCNNIRYCAELEYSTIPNLSDKALTTRKGDCGVQGMAFITLCRAAGVPARWQSGWELRPVGWNMHDWAEFYVEPWGWLPADPSFGLQDHADPKVREFYFGHMDAYRLIVNLDYARELHPPKNSFRSEPNDFQRGEIEIDGKNLYYDEWDWSLEFTSTPVESAPLTTQPVGPDGIGKLFLPSTFAPRDGTIDLLIQFHAATDLVVQSAEKAGLTAAVVSINRPGLSKSYEEPFGDPNLLGDVIRSSLESLSSSGRIEPPAKLGQLYLTSFSAGFGALRAILRVPDYFDQIDGIVLADSLYCGYDGPAEDHKLDDIKMADFRRFAREAAAARKYMLITHSAQNPPGYASTTETADELIAVVGAKRTSDPASGPGNMRRVTRAELGNFHVLGFAGDEGADHGEHVRNLAAWYALLPRQQP